MVMEIDLVDSAQMAESSGMTLPSFRVALTRSRSRRVREASIPTDVPEPDFTIGRSPVWTTKSHDSWLAARAVARRKPHLKEVSD